MIWGVMLHISSHFLSLELILITYPEQTKRLALKNKRKRKVTVKFKMAEIRRKYGPKLGFTSCPVLSIHAFDKFDRSVV